MVGTFNCSCQFGFLLDIDGRTCDRELFCQVTMHCQPPLQLCHIADPDRVCPEDNECEQLCALDITTQGSASGSGAAVEESSEIVCSCLSGFTLANNSANCTGILACVMRLKVIFLAV